MNKADAIVEREVHKLSQEELVELVLKIYHLPYGDVQESISKAIDTNHLIIDTVLAHLQDGE